MATSQVFVQLASSWDTVITTGLTATTANAVAQNATLLGSILTLWIIISGCLTMFGRMGMVEWTFGAVRAAIIAMLLTLTAFNQYISTPLQTTIPNWIASTTSNGGTTTSPQQFDALYNQVGVRIGTIEQQLTWTDIGPYIECAAISVGSLVELIVMFLEWEFAKGMLGLLVAAAP